MTVVQAVVLGVVQGISELLPISSSGHLIAIPTLLGWDAQSLFFDVVMHLGTLLAIIVMMRKDILLALKSKKRLAYIAVATIPIGLVGVFAPDSTLLALRTTQIVAFSLIFWGIVLWIADWYSTTVKEQSSVKQLTWAQIIAVGMAQALALIPGTSRSGITMTTGLFAGMTREAAARFSFLIAIPAIAGAGLLTLIDAMQTGMDIDYAPLTTGFIAAFASSMLAIHFLLKFIQQISYKWFAMYRILLGIVLLIFFI